MDLSGASADALASLRDELSSALAAGADPKRVGDDLFAVARMLRSDAALRRIATDVSVSSEAKQRLVRDLLAGKAEESVVALVGSAVAQRWTASRHLADALERLSEIAVVRSAGDEAADRLGDELFSVGQLVEDNPALRDALSDPARDLDDKLRLVDDLLGDKALPATVSLVEHALRGSYRTVSAALAEYQKVAAAVNGERVAKVRVARELDDDELRRLGDALSRSYGRAVHLNVVVEPELIGGVRVEIGDDVIDGSVAARLDDARRRLAG